MPEVTREVLRKEVTKLQLQPGFDTLSLKNMRAKIGQSLGLLDDEMMRPFKDDQGARDRGPHGAVTFSSRHHRRRCRRLGYCAGAPFGNEPGEQSCYTSSQQYFAGEPTAQPCAAAPALVGQQRRARDNEARRRPVRCRPRR